MVTLMKYDFVNALLPEKIKKLNIRSKFNVFLIACLLPLAICLALVIYFHEKKLLLIEANQKAAIVFAEASAIRDYVENSLRPRMYDVIPGDQFIIEAMSTTFVSVNIQKLFSERMQGYLYRRIAIKPRNPANAMDDQERSVWEIFRNNRELDSWSGEIVQNNERFLLLAQKVVLSDSCLRCHGNPEDAPGVLRETYGNVAGFGYQSGDLMGLNLVSVPVHHALEKISAVAWTIAIATLVGFALVVVAINLVFNKLVAHRLGFLTRLSERLIEQETLPDKSRNEQTNDEFEMLQEKMDFLARHVRTLRGSYGLGPKFAGMYVIESPIFPGFVSWLYSARHSLTAQKVSLKIPFPSLIDNPYYYHAFVNELQTIEKLDHPNVLKVVERENDFLVTEMLTGQTLADFLRLNGKLVIRRGFPIFQQMCDVVSYLHNNGVVCHNLTPSSIVILDNDRVKLIDFGLAWNRDLVDPIKEAGAGLQGNPDTIAPEQIRGERGDYRSDIYAVGCITYVMLTGHFPFALGPSGERLGLKMLLRPTPLRLHSPDISPLIEEIVMKSIESDPEDRYQWIEDFCRDFRSAMRD